MQSTTTSMLLFLKLVSLTALSAQHLTNRSKLNKILYCLGHTRIFQKNIHFLLKTFTSFPKAHSLSCTRHHICSCNTSVNVQVLYLCSTHHRYDCFSSTESGIRNLHRLSCTTLFAWLCKSLALTSLY